MKKCKLTRIICFLIITVLLGTSCSAKQETSGGKADNNSEGPVVIKFGVEDTRQELYDAFHETNPDIKVVYEDVPSESDKLMAMLAAGTAPDLIRVTGALTIPGYAMKGIALNLDPYFEKSEIFTKDNLLPICNVFRFDGKKVGTGPYYGLPKDWSNDTGLFINKQVFKDASLEIPSETEALTYSELFEIAGKINKYDENGVLTRLGLNCTAVEGVVNYGTLLFQLEQMGCSLWSEDYSTSRWDAPEVKALVKQWIDAKKELKLKSPLLDETGLGGIGDNAVGIENWGYWATGMYRGDSKLDNRLDDIIMIPSPYVEGTKATAACTFATGGIIYSKTKHPEEAFKVFEWYFGGAPAEDRAKSGWGLPVLKNLWEMIPQETSFDQQTYRVVKNELDNLIYINVNPYLSTKYQLVIDKFLQPVLFGKEDLDTALAKLKKETDLLAEEGMIIAGVK